MLKFRIKRICITILLVLVGFVLQCTLFARLSLGSIKPNILLIIAASVGFLRGPKAGMLTGFLCGILIDIQFGEVLGLYALFYLIIGYVNGLLGETYYEEHIKLPVVFIAASELCYGVLIYLFMFMMRSEFDFPYYFSHIIIPELIYTILVAIVLYPLIRLMNHRMETEEKRSIGKLV